MTTLFAGVVYGAVRGADPNLEVVAEVNIQNRATEAMLHCAEQENYS